jgi:hypothetical protein
MLSKISQTEKDKYYKFSFVCRIKTLKIDRNIKGEGIARERVKREG